jgi:PAS domain S-box-containing protein
MIEAAIPPDEAERLQDLRRLAILDTAPEERFDRITRTASRLFDVPIALVSLVDIERQWFKSRVGLADAQTPRRVSFCAHAILRDAPFIIPDAHADERFADNPLVTGPPHVRFYAGVPLRGPTGKRIATLCLIDRKPRTFGQGDVAALVDLAAWAELELNLDSLEHLTQVARDREEKLQAVLDNAGDAIVTLTPCGDIESFNIAAGQMFGGTSESIGKSVFEWVGEESREDIWNAFNGGEADAPSAMFRRELTCRHSNGTRFPGEVVANRMRDAGYTLIVRDMSERKQVERMKNEFIGTVSHELRTPLTSVRGSLGLLLGGAVGEVPPKARGLLEIAANNCDRLVRLINDMLDVEKIESGNVRFDMVAQPLLPLVRQAMAATEGFGQQFQVRYALDPQAADVRVLVDADRMTQVVVNLLSNAAKFSPRGSAVDVGVRRLDGESPRLRLTVADRGPGIPPEFRERMFTRFLQADSSDTRTKTGTGLGLAISRAIVQRLGGSIGFEDREGGGTVFFVELPVLSEPKKAASPAPSGTVLVCEDDPDVARAMCALLEHAGFTCDVAHSAADARRMLAAHDYRAMTLDVGLPDEDGLSLLRWLRSQPHTAKLPVLVATAHEAPGGNGAAAFGAMDWLVKPIDPDRLLAAVRGALSHGSGDGRPVLLHVEDDPDLVRIVATLLEEGCDVVPAMSLAQARGQLATRPFDLILLDMQLPDGDGSELLASLPAPNAATPVVIFSANEVGAELAARVQQSLVKSRTSNSELVALLHRLMRRGGTQEART